MKKILFILTIFFSIFTNGTSKVTSSEASYYARNYIVMDDSTHEVLEGKAIYNAYSVASISKIMTAILALESEQLFKVIIVDDIINTIEGSSLYLSIGNQITILDLVYGLLLRSGNDAAVLIAKNVSKNIDDFVFLMNQKAKEIGMKNTTFHNPSGLDIFDEGNISSCYDMALLMSYCLENDLFKEIIHTSSYKNAIKGIWGNKNKLLKQYEYCIGGKTGYTKKARRTLINASEKEGQTLIVVTLDCGSDFAFHKALFEKYFNQFHYLLALQKGRNYIDQYYIETKKNYGIRIPKSIALKGTLVYEIYHGTTTLHIYFILESGVQYDGGSFDVEIIKKA